MKKHYIFLIILWIILYLMYLIVEYKYKEYKITSKIELLEKQNKSIKNEIIEYKEYLEYLNTASYKNKILKLDQALKSKGEEVVFITTSNFYEKYSVKLNEEVEVDIPLTDSERLNKQEKHNLEKWIYFLFKKDLELNL